jgi:tRNA-uridine 2-sulfurtransferase
MSGGVDSSVAAALLAAAGHEVVGLSMQLYDRRGREDHFGSCCTIDDLYDARRVATQLGFPHYILNLEREFRETVIANFVSEYAAGRTPIPCTRCNTDVKFSTLLDRARGLGAEHVATGHYARVEQRLDGTWTLWRSVDATKDQSYFLFALTQEQLARVWFPLGAMMKQDVRARASELGLAVANKPDSQEICFVPDGDYAAFVERVRPHAAAPGPIREANGRTLGTHEGVHRFTVGQRKGLKLSSREPLYVTRIDPVDRSVTVGPRSALECATVEASTVSWIAGAPPSGHARVHAQIRHRHSAAPATVEATDAARARVRFDTPQTAASPGQAIVFYDGDQVLGGGWIV